jgi:hypothetical protein
MKGLSGARLLVAAAILLGSGGAVLATDKEQEASPRRWSWLAETLWYVPQESLPSILTSATNRKVTRMIDQTVYSIDGYHEGFIWGVLRGQIMPLNTKLPAEPDDSPTCMRLAGSVTPQGAINISLTPMDGSPRATGIGKMQRYDGVWTMQLQMTTGETEQLSHWAYMKPCPANGRCPLPAIKGSAQAFLKPCREAL